MIPVCIWRTLGTLIIQLLCEMNKMHLQTTNTLFPVCLLSANKFTKYWSCKNDTVNLHLLYICCWNCCSAVNGHGTRQCVWKFSIIFEMARLDKDTYCRSNGSVDKILHQFLSSSWSIHLIENWSTSCYVWMSQLDFVSEPIDQ
jgi:hypothetical protein